ncbi:unnamed protein product [Pleuronectes platessa]|uniref:Uncharacterized protein n=1 Tax=Pleuronectes platessa TaxID=8262 RepID=A0A9N7UAU2_PLEPL|nr:unnamed protein product [Pleuronectes platessa]
MPGLLAPEALEIRALPEDVSWLDAESAHPHLSAMYYSKVLRSSKGQCMLLRFDGHGQIGPPSPTWNALSVPLRGSSESFSCSSHFSNYITYEMTDSPRIALGCDWSANASISGPQTSGSIPYITINQNHNYDSMINQCQCSDSHNLSSTPISSSPEKNIQHLFRIPMTTDHGLSKTLHYERTFFKGSVSCQGHFGMQVGKSGDLTANVLVGERPLYPLGQGSPTPGLVPPGVDWPSGIPGIVPVGR